MSVMKGETTRTRPPPPVSQATITRCRVGEIFGFAKMEEWDTVQKQMRGKIINCDTEKWQFSEDLSGLTRVAGVDVSIDAKDNAALECDAFAAVVICNFPTMEIIHEETKRVHLSVPYVPGYLAFRECEPVIDLIQNIVDKVPEKTPDVLLVDGNGYLHPRRCGLACHIGVRTSIPTIGVAKNLHLVEGVNITKQMVQGMTSKGDCTIITSNDSSETIGMALKTAPDTKNPMYISVGHKISLETAKRVVLKCCKYRIPDPIRFADNISRELLKEFERKSQSEN